MNINDIESLDQKQTIRKISKSTRRWRRTHYYTGLTIAILLFISAATGILLGWKKDAVFIQPATMTGETGQLSRWLHLSEIEDMAYQALIERAPGDFTIDKMDVRPDKGIVKITYKPGYWEVQIDGSTGKVLSVEKRYSDLIEKIHDGSIIGDGFKLVSMNILGICSIIMILSGFWLWYAPKIIRKLKR